MEFVLIKFEQHYEMIDNRKNCSELPAATFLYHFLFNSSAYYSDSAYS